MAIAVVNSGGANISSVLHALGRLGAEPRFTHDADVIRSADRVILPGVGAAGNAMDVLRGHGLVDVIRELSRNHAARQHVCRHCQPPCRS